MVYGYRICRIFHNTTPGYDVLHLHRGDAEFVQAIHTTGRYNPVSLVAVTNPIGHADFYPNGGAGIFDGFQGGCVGNAQCTHRNWFCIPLRTSVLPRPKGQLVVNAQPTKTKF